MDDNKYKSVQLNLGTIFSPAISIIVIAILFFVTLKVGMPRVLNQRKTLKEIGTQEEALRSKLSRLNELKIEYSTQVDPVAIAFPDKNPSLLMVSQVRRVAGENTLEVKDVKSEEGMRTESQNFSSVGVSFQVSGSLDNVFNLVLSTKNYAPLTSIEKMDVDVGDNEVTAEIIFAGYYAPYPEKLPPIDKPVAELTEDEQRVLGSVASLTQPEFFDVTALPAVDRPNPFSFSQ